MKLNSQIATTVEQSKKLLKLGLKPETADMILLHNIFSKTYEILPKAFPTDTKYYIPAWSLHRLIELYKDVEDTSMWSLGDVNYNRLIQCIGLAIKHGAFNKEYLKL